MLLNLVLLARTAKSFEDALARAFPEDGEVRETFRMRIENTLFVQPLVGGRLEREGINAKLLSLMVLITLALAPVALLLMIQIKFLPYHSEWITWLHRGLLTLDLVLVWTLWPGYRSGWGVRLWPNKIRTFVWLVPLSAVAWLYAFLLATFPDEWINVATYWLHGSTYLDPDTGDVVPINRPNWYPWITWPNTLDLHGEDLIDEIKLAHIVKKNESSTDLQTWETPRWVATLSLAGRNLVGANLREADVRHVDFSDAILNRADLSYAWGEKVHFNNSQLQGAALEDAQLKGASLQDAQLQGAALMDAQLQGATLDNARLQGASLERSQLEGASLMGAQLKCASLDHAVLHGASLERAQLQGASLVDAELHGASFKQATLQGAALVGVCSWRADARGASWQDTRVELPKAGEIDKCNWTVPAFAAFKQLISQEVPEDAYKRTARVWVEQRLDPTKTLEDEEEMAKIWAARESEAPAPETYEKSLAVIWRDVGCTAEAAPYVLHGLVAQLNMPDNSLFRDHTDAEKALAAAFLDDAHCAGAHGLSDDDKATLKKIAAQASPPAPKP
jgi:uncharacterized protein YjbI with pentapeptide repeats